MPSGEKQRLGGPEGLRFRVDEHEQVLAVNLGKDVHRGRSGSANSVDPRLHVIVHGKPVPRTLDPKNLMQPEAFPLPKKNWLRGSHQSDLTAPKPFPPVADKGREIFCKILTSIPRGNAAFGEVSTGAAEECPKAFWTAGTRVEGPSEGDRVLEHR